MIQPAHVPCIPDIGFMHGADPQEPLMVDIARFNFFNVIIHKHCTPDSRMDIKWTVHNSIGTSEAFSSWTVVFLNFSIHLQFCCLNSAMQAKSSSKLSPIDYGLTIAAQWHNPTWYAWMWTSTKATQWFIKKLGWVWLDNAINVSLIHVFF